MNKPRLYLITVFLSTLLPAMFAGSFPSRAGQLTIMTHDSFNVSKSVVAAFEKKAGVTLRFLKAGDAGAALNQAILSKNNPLADVFYGVDNTFLSRALQADIFIPHSSALLANFPDHLKLDPGNRLLPVNFGDVCLNYDKGWFRSRGIQPPADMADLADSRYRSLTVVMNPATSSPGLAFLVATVGRFGDPGYLGYWGKLRDNDVLITNGWSEAYWGAFSAASKGTRPIVVSYASSPPAEVFFAKQKPAEAPTAAITSGGNCFRQIEFAGILKGTRNGALAAKLMDFMLDVEFQEDIPLQMFVFPGNRKARLPDVFTRHTKTAERPVTLTPEKIVAGREQWISAWTETVLR